VRTERTNCYVGVAVKEHVKGGPQGRRGSTQEKHKLVAIMPGCCHAVGSETGLR